MSESTLERFTRDTAPVVPAGKVQLAEYGSYDPALDAKITPISAATGAIHGFPTVELEHITRGFVIAGSMMRWDEACWSVTWTDFDGSIQGRRFKEANEAAARAYFTKLTDHEAISRMRQQAAMREDIEREEAAKAAAAADKIQVEAAKTYKSGWQYRADYPGFQSWCGFEKTKKAALAAGRRALERAIRREF